MVSIPMYASRIEKLSGVRVILLKAQVGEVQSVKTAGQRGTK